METIVDAFHSRMDPAAVAFRQANGDDAIGYGAFDGWVRQVAQAVAQAGAGGGCRVAVAMPRSPLALALFLGVATANICCPMNPGLRAEEVARFLEITGADLLVTGPGDTLTLAVAEELGLSTLAVNHDRSGPLDIRCARKRPSLAVEPAGTPDPYALLLQTSGTTSAPKLVPLRHSQILVTVRGICDAFALSASDVCLNPMPFQHAHGLLTAGMSSLLAGSTAVCLPGFSAAAFLAAFDRHRPTWFTGSPAMHIALLEQLPTRGAVAGSLRFLRSSSAPLPSNIITRLEAAFGAPLIETYGLTETASMITTNPLPPGERKTGSVGRACAQAEIAIGGIGDAALPPGEPGEILVRGPSVISHYGFTAAPDPENFVNGWLRTGDVGHLDSDGYLFITGRTKELIKRGGLSVYPSEIDNELMALPEIADAATFSIPHPTLGEEVVALVVAAQAGALDEAALRRHLLLRLSSYKVPSAIIQVVSILKGDTGKIARREIARRFAEELAPAGTGPADDTERALLAAWHETIGRTDLGVTDNLFLFGADPIRSERVRDSMAAAGHALARTFAFHNPTVRAQAAMLRAG